MQCLCLLVCSAILERNEILEIDFTSYKVSEYFPTLQHEVQLVCVVRAKVPYRLVYKTHFFAPKLNIKSGGASYT